jgi:hypothetical protein
MTNSDTFQYLPTSAGWKLDAEASIIAQIGGLFASEIQVSDFEPDITTISHRPIAAKWMILAKPANRKELWGRLLSNESYAGFDFDPFAALAELLAEDAMLPAALSMGQRLQNSAEIDELAIAATATTSDGLFDPRLAPNYLSLAYATFLRGSLGARASPYWSTLLARHRPADFPLSRFALNGKRRTSSRLNSSTETGDFTERRTPAKPRSPLPERPESGGRQEVVATGGIAEMRAQLKALRAELAAVRADISGNTVTLSSLRADLANVKRSAPAPVSQPSEGNTALPQPRNFRALAVAALALVVSAVAYGTYLAVQMQSAVGQVAVLQKTAIGYVSETRGARDEALAARDQVKTDSTDVRSTSAEEQAKLKAQAEQASAAVRKASDDGQAALAVAMEKALVALGKASHDAQAALAAALQKATAR